MKQREAGELSDRRERVREILERYQTAAPRYTSYPTAPVWSEAYGPGSYLGELAALGSDPVSLYVHVPFCRSLCHFCACNRIITRDSDLPRRYLELIEREIATVREAIPGAPLATQIHWGGGTPTHLAPEQIRRLLAALCGAFPVAPDAELSIEVDPRVTTPEHVEALREGGFNRISMGVQDFDPRVQEAIHRTQPPGLTAQLVDRARRAGFESVSFDLIYGLPFQTPVSFDRTLEQVLEIAPDRVALYAYAHVTWIAKQQRGFERQDLPTPENRFEILVRAVQRFLDAGYVYVGMDHFAQPEDALVRALEEGTLRRNFMGYTTQAGVDLIGFGPSAISELQRSYAQSHRGLQDWEDAVRQRGVATFRGHVLSPDDQIRRWVISQIMCRGSLAAGTYREAFGADFAERHGAELRRLAPMVEDGLLCVEDDGSLRLRPLGRLLVRNVASVFDAYLPDQAGDGERRFSQTV